MLQMTDAFESVRDKLSDSSAELICGTTDTTMYIIADVRL